MMGGGTGRTGPVLKIARWRSVDGEVSGGGGGG